ncbi:MAG: hypothetical protein FWC16_00575 [Defluviitaleaceae bacterium]|nr:hypothetical protein [Defluviitaleaceae bacterium]MCL2273398.1 hypothetical protein [Defluviitaleaceae bacterium]
MARNLWILSDVVIVLLVIAAGVTLVFALRDLFTKSKHERKAWFETNGPYWAIVTLLLLILAAAI